MCPIIHTSSSLSINTDVFLGSHRSQRSAAISWRKQAPRGRYRGRGCRRLRWTSPPKANPERLCSSQCFFPRLPIHGRAHCPLKHETILFPRSESSTSRPTSWISNHDSSDAKFYAASPRVSLDYQADFRLAVQVERLRIWAL